MTTYLHLELRLRISRALRIPPYAFMAGKGTILSFPTVTAWPLEKGLVLPGLCELTRQQESVLLHATVHTCCIPAVEL